MRHYYYIVTIQGFLKAHKNTSDLAHLWTPLILLRTQLVVGGYPEHLLPTRFINEHLSIILVGGYFKTSFTNLAPI